MARADAGRSRETDHDAPGLRGGPGLLPDGTRIAFTSNRTGQDQVFVVDVAGGIPRQVTFHSEGSRVVEWYPDGQSLLIEGLRDFGSKSAARFYRVEPGERKAERLLFDAEGHSGALSPDGKRLLFCREGSDLYRKGYRGSKASQIWLAEGLETEKPVFKKLIARDSEARSPMWKPDGSGFYYLGDQGEKQLFDVWEHDLASGAEKALTTMQEDPAIGPTIARDGSAIVFREEFDFVRLPLTGKGAKKGPRPLAFEAAADTLPDPEVRRVLAKADNVTFSADGLEMAFTAGGDIWVMDSELKEPVAVTSTPDEEREPVFSADGESIFFIRDRGDSADLWSAARADAKAYWWRNTAFKETRLTKDGAAKQDLQVVPGGKRISWISGAGDLWVSNRDGGEAKRLLESWNAPRYEWSPDGQWLAYAVADNDFNSDIWIAAADGKTPAYNLSRHPDIDTNPAWSPDGKILAFTGRRYEDETDIYYVHLSLADEQKDKRDRTLESALKKMEAARKKPEPARPRRPLRHPPRHRSRNPDHGRDEAVRRHHGARAARRSRQGGHAKRQTRGSGSGVVHPEAGRPGPDGEDRFRPPLGAAPPHRDPRRHRIRTLLVGRLQAPRLRRGDQGRQGDLRRLLSRSLDSVAAREQDRRLRPVDFPGRDDPLARRGPPRLPLEGDAADLFLQRAPGLRTR